MASGTEVGRIRMGMFLLNSSTMGMLMLNSSMVGVKEKLPSGKLPKFSTI
jgi:hypothetical protein